MIVEGNRFSSDTTKVKGSICAHSSETSGTFEFVEHNHCSKMRDIGFQAGRTIELKRFEFARVKLGLVVGMCDFDRDDVQEAIENFILDRLRKEEKAIGKTDYLSEVSDLSVSMLDNCKCRRILVSYGLTLKSGRNEYESHTVDVSEELPIKDGESVIAAFDSLSDYLTVQLKRHHNRIKEVESV